MPAVTLALGLLSACGGKVFLDEPGAGGGGGSSTSTSASAGGGVGGCDELLQELSDKVAAATACNPFVNSIQCDGSALVSNACGCDILANETQPDAVDAALQTFSALNAAGCTMECAFCPPAGPGFCQPSPDGKTGVCAVALPD